MQNVGITSVAGMASQNQAASALQSSSGQIGASSLASSQLASSSGATNQFGQSGSSSSVQNQNSGQSSSNSNAASAVSNSASAASSAASSDSTQLQSMSSESSSSTSEESSSSVTTSSYFSSVQTFVETITFDVFSTTTYSLSGMDFTGETALNQYQGGGGVSVPAGQIVLMGSVINFDIKLLPPRGCVQQGCFPMADNGMYFECIPVPGVGFKPLIRRCSQGYIFNTVSSSCISAGATDMIRFDLGLRLGPGPQMPPTITGEVPLVGVAEFQGINPICVGPGPRPFGEEDRYFVNCRGANSEG